MVAAEAAPVGRRRDLDVGSHDWNRPSAWRRAPYGAEQPRGERNSLQCIGLGAVRGNPAASGAGIASRSEICVAFDSAWSRWRR